MTGYRGDELFQFERGCTERLQQVYYKSIILRILQLLAQLDL